MPPRLNLRHLSVFKAVAETGSFTAAARRLGISQPGLSSAIRQFEEDLGTALFRRDTRNVSLTAEGSALLPHVDVALTNADRAAEDIHDVVSGRRVRVEIASISAVTSYLLPSALAAYSDNAAVNVRDVENTTVKSLVSQGDADIGIGIGPFDAEVFGEHFLFSDALQLVVARDHPLAAREQIAWEEATHWPIACYRETSNVYCTIKHTLARHRILFAPVATYSFRQSIFGAVLNGKYVAILPGLSLQETMPPGLHRLALVDPMVERHVGLIVPRARAVAAEATELATYLSETLRRNRPITE